MMYKMNLKTLLKTVLSPAIKLDLITLIKYFQLTLVSSLLLLVSLVAVSLTLSIKWLSVIIIYMVGKLRLLVQKISQRISTLIN